MREHKYRVCVQENGVSEFHFIDLSDGVSEYESRILQEFPVSEYTGLKDKNGEEVFEGDIFQDDEDGSCEFVEWDEEFGGWRTQAWYSIGEFAQNAEHLEIIGNIYENPELLHQEEERE